MTGGPTLLLGATSFIARHVRVLAREQGIELVTASRGGEGADLACDVTDESSVTAAVAEAAPRRIINLAGLSSVARSRSHPEENMAVNARGVDLILKHSGDAHVLCMSSAEVYGIVREEELPLTEESPIRPCSPYADSKVEMERSCAMYTAEGRQIAVMRSFNQIGPGQSKTYAASSFARQIVEAEGSGSEVATITVGNLEARRDFLDVRDGARALLAVSQAGLSGTYNLCSGKPLRVADLIELMRPSTGLEIDIITDPALGRASDLPVTYGSSARLQDATGWEPQIPIGNSVADLLDWWRAAGVTSSG